MKINSVKKLYHGTANKFETFDFNKAKPFKDFGRGYYLTTDFIQAQKWAQKRADNLNETYIYSYEINHVDSKEWKVLELLQYDENWVDFIAKCRIEGYETEHDIIYDKMADNRFHEIAEALQQYAAHEIDSQEVVSRIKWNNHEADQYCFKTERALGLLKNREIIVQCRDDKGKWIIKECDRI